MFNLFGKKDNITDGLFFKTDIHCHIVPGIDDGSSCVKKSVDLVRRMERWGLKRIIATPHVTEDSFENTPEIIRGAFCELKNGLEEAGIGVDIGYSAEYRIDDFFMRQIDGGQVIPFPNKYLLVENSFVQEPWNLDQILFQLKIKGFRPILAHPERYIYYYGKKGRYEELHSTGTLFQINLLSLSGFYGKDQRKMAEFLIERGLVDLVGTDLHRFAHADSIERYIESKDYKRHRAALEGRIRNDVIFN